MSFRTFTNRAFRVLGSSFSKAEPVAILPVVCVSSYQQQQQPLRILSKREQSVRTIHDQSISRKAATASEPQLTQSGRTPAIRAAYRSGDDRRHLLVELSDGQRFEFPLVWLRDNCQCAECFHPGSYSRVLNWQLFDVERVNPSKVVLADGGTHVDIEWEDGHRSQFDCDWLLERNFTDENRQEYLDEWYRPPPRLWKKDDFGDIIRNFDFKDVIHSDEALQGWIEALIKFGTVMIKNTPLQETECRRLAERVGFIRKTHYGEEFIVKAKEGTSNVAYLSTPLQMHTDLPYYDYKPGCNLLHCLIQSQSQGGANLITDGFYVADLMRREFPEEFETLSTTLINWTDVGEDEGGQFHSIYRAPMICIGRDGKLERINHSIPQRDSFFNVPLQRVEPWYRALARFVKLIHQEAVEFKTTPGDILTFSNIRMIHGRTGYTDTSANTRHIVGAYLDWDEIYSKLRVLKSKTLK